MRLTHIPSGIVVYCQEERSQHKNKDKAMRFLKAKIAEVEQKQQAEIASTRALKWEVGIALNVSGLIIFPKSHDGPSHQSYDI